MKKLIILVVIVFCGTLNAQRILRVNNGVLLNDSSALPPNSFSNIGDALLEADPAGGDIIYLEPSTTSYGSIILEKPVTIIGNGFFLEGSSGNPDLQENTSNSILTTITLRDGSEGSRFVGLQVSNFSFNTIPSPCNITIEKCYILGGISGTSNTSYSNIEIRKNYFFNQVSIFNNSTIILADIFIENNIFRSDINSNSSNSSSNLVFRNNVGSRPFLTGYYVANNIFTTTSTILSFTNCIIRNNIFASNQSANVTVGPISGPGGANNGNNLVSQPVASVIVNSGSSDGRYQLAAGSPAIGGGVDISGDKPDCGAFGGNDPYKLSGIPDIPTIYELTFPNGNSVPTGSPTLTIDLKTRSNN